MNHLPRRNDEASCTVKAGLTAVHTTNPSLLNVPEVPTTTLAISTMMRLQPIYEEKNDSEAGFNRLGNLFVPTLSHASILQDVVSQVRGSYLGRDLRDPAYRKYIIASHTLVHGAYDRHGHALPVKSIIAPHAQARGVFVCAASQMGRTQLANQIETYLGRGSQIIRIDGSHDKTFTDYVQLKVLRVQWPADGSLKHFTKNFLAAFDAEIGTDYSARERGPFSREHARVPAICSLAAAVNLGILMVERINTKAAACPAAANTWDALGAFTRVTGIPVLCLATPGAAVGLVEQSGAIGDLVSSQHIVRLQTSNSPNWMAITDTFFKAAIADARLPTMPGWFREALWRVASGHPGLAAKVCNAIARQKLSLPAWILTQSNFDEIAMDCLTLFRPHLEAAKAASSGGEFSAINIRRHGDWLPLNCVVKTANFLSAAKNQILASGG